LPIHSRTLLLFLWNQGNNLFIYRYKIKELELLASSAPVVAEKPAEKPAAK